MVISVTDAINLFDTIGLRRDVYGRSREKTIKFPRWSVVTYGHETCLNSFFLVYICYGIDWLGV